MKTLTKKQLALKMQVSQSTLQNYLNRLWFNQLSKLGYKKRNKILSIRQLGFIKEVWGDFDD